MIVLESLEVGVLPPSGSLEGLDGLLDTLDVTARGEETSELHTAKPVDLGGEIEARLGGRLFAFERLAPGFYTVTVEPRVHPEVPSQTRQVRVDPRPTKTIFKLHRQGAPQVPRCGVRIDYQPHPGRLGIVLTEFEAPAALAELLEAAGVERVEPASEVDGRRGERALVVTETSGPGTAELARLRQRDDLVRWAGPLFRLDPPYFTLFTEHLLVRFQPWLTPDDIERALKEAGRPADGEGPPIPLERQPVSLAPGLFLVAAPPATDEAGILELVERLAAREDVEHAEPHLVEVIAGDSLAEARTFLWPVAWDRHRCQVGEAWRCLEQDLHPNLARGRPEITLAVVDNHGLRSVHGVPEHPDFRGTLSDGRPRVRLLVDAETLHLDHNRSRRTRAHAVRCAGIANGGSVGVAANTQLLAIRNGVASECRLAETFAWAAGTPCRLTTATFPNVLEPGAGADVFSTSVPYGKGGALPAVAEAMLTRLTRRGRRGRGCLLFFSAGNENSNLALSAPYGSSEHAFACAASTVEGGAEKRAPYSNFGPVDLCAPSSRRKQNLQKFQGTGTVTADPRIHLPSAPRKSPIPTLPALVFQLAQKAPGGTDTLVLEPATSHPEAHPRELPTRWPLRLREAVISAPGNPQPARQSVRLQGQATSWTVKVQPRTWRAHPKGTLVISGMRRLATLTRTIGPRDQPTLTVDEVTGITVGMTIFLWPTNVNGRSRRPEPVTVLSPPAADGTFTISGVSRRYIAHATEVLVGEQSHTDDFGGTSSSTPLAAGIAALVLSAHPGLTWVEAREILRTTAVKIDLTNGLWLDDARQPTTDPDAAVWSPLYGYGRLDAAAAVAQALAEGRKNGGHPRDLMVRNALGDDGSTPLPATGHLDSPDVWVRRRAPGVDDGARPASVGEAGPHQPPRRGERSWIYVRIHNRGVEPSLDAWVRISVAAQPPERPFRFPEDWDPVNGVCHQARGAWDRGTFFIGEIALPPIAPGESAIVHHPWPAAQLPPDSTPDGEPWDPHLLVEVSPLDGPLDGDGVADNNNLAQRRIEIAGGF